MGKHLSEQEKQFIVDNFNSMTIVAIAKHLRLHCKGEAINLVPLSELARR